MFFESPKYSKLFDKHVKEMLNKKKISIVTKYPDDIKFFNYDVGFTREYLEQVGIELIMERLTSEILHMIFCDHASELEKEHYPFHSIYFKKKPKVKFDSIKAIYTATCRFGSFISKIDKLSDHIVTEAITL